MHWKAFVGLMESGKGKAFGLLFSMLFLLPSFALAQEAATIAGIVTDGSGKTLPGASVFIEELQNQGVGTTTDAEGNYSFTVPSRFVEGQTVTLVVQFVGYSPNRREITLSPGTQEQLFELRGDALQLEEVVITGVSGPVQTKKLPFAVGQVGEEELEEAPPATDPVSALQGRVSGVQVVRGRGTPGTGVSVQLRGITSITGDSEPLYIVDGIYMEEGLVDIDALDVKSIEVVKGAAAASLYGSQAQNGVVRITTKRGEGIAEGQTQVTLRNEFGINQLKKQYDISRHHALMVADSRFEDAAGNQVEPGDWLRENNDGEIFKADYNTASFDEQVNGLGFQDNPYPKFNDHVDAVFNVQPFIRNSVAISNHTGDTNFRVSLANLRENGVVNGGDGYSRQNVRFNADHRVLSDLKASISGYLSVSNRDDPFVGGEIFSAPLFISPAVSLKERDENGELLIQPDQTTLYENPLYRLKNRSIDIGRNRATGNVGLQYTPLRWLELEGNFSYDRSNQADERFWDIGFKTSRASDPVQDGRYLKSSNEREHWDASASATLTRVFFDDLRTRTTLKAIADKTQINYTYAAGDDLASKGVRGLDNIEGNLTTRSNFTDVRSTYGLITTQLDFRDRYIADFLVRRDGSSLFGPEERWQTYFRASGAYRISAEPWWPLKNGLNEFKLRYSYGTAGGQPSFEAQYETYRVAGGRIQRGTLGNRQLEPEYQVEQSFGLDFAVLDRVSAKLTYTRSTVEDQLLEVPLPGYFGYDVQWRNAGTVESNTYEADINASLIERGDLQWSAGLVFSKYNSTITEFNRTPFNAGPLGLFRYEEGTEFGTMYGTTYAHGVGDLPEEMQQYADQFAVNDEGYLVVVGEGNSWKDGIRNELWGTQVDVDGDGTSDYEWGMPIADEVNADIGNTIPDFTVGLNTDFTWHGLSASMLWDAQFGGDIYNFISFFSIPRNVAAVTDQAGKPSERKKPTAYYSNFEGANERNVEDGTYLKLRELSLSYTFDSEDLTGLLGTRVGDFLDQVSLGITGRNLLTFTDYTGYDPEVGAPGDAAEFRFGGFRYPRYRTFTGTLGVQF